MREVIHINTELIVPNRNQPRFDFYDETIEGLAESIRENGLLQPITVRKIDDRYELIAGERRYRACVLNGYKEIEAIVMDSDDEESANLALIENLQREDLNAVEQAMAMQRLMRIENLTQAELAKKLGYRQSTVANKLRLLRLPEYVKSAIGHGTLTERHARALLNVEEDKIEEVYMTIVNRGYNVSKTEEYIREMSNHHHKGVSNNVRIATNTLKEAYEMCRRSGVDADFRQTEYEDEIKIVIKIKK